MCVCVCVLSESLHLFLSAVVEWVDIESRKLVGVIDSTPWTLGYTYVTGSACVLHQRLEVVDRGSHITSSLSHNILEVTSISN